MDYGELDLDGEFRFTIQDREYVVPSVDWPTYLELRQMQDGAVEAAKKENPDFAEVKFYEVAAKVLGPVLGELIEAGVPGPKITFAARAAFYHQIGEPELARLLWGEVEQSGGEGKSAGVDFDDPDWIDQFGQGEIDPATGLYDSYDIPDDVNDALIAHERADAGLSWRDVDVVGRFGLIECDFQSHYGLDLSDLRGKSAHWFRRRVLGLLQADTRLSRVLAPADKQQEASEL